MPDEEVVAFRLAETMSEAVKLVSVPAYPPLAVGHERLSIDTEADLNLVRMLYEKTGAAAGDLALTDVLALMQADPGLRQIIAHVRQKALTQQSRQTWLTCVHKLLFIMMRTTANTAQRQQPVQWRLTVPQPQVLARICGTIQRSLRASRQLQLRPAQRFRPLPLQ